MYQVFGNPVSILFESEFKPIALLLKNVNGSPSAIHSIIAQL
jgi:hypothetical protein